MEGRLHHDRHTLLFIPQACGLIIFWGQLSLDDREQPVSLDLSPHPNLVLVLCEQMFSSYTLS